MRHGIAWVFFDVGSTLVDESKAYQHRIHDAIAGSDVTFSQFYDTMLDFYRQNKKGDLETIKLFGLNKTPWHSEDEILYPQAVDCLKTLRRKFKIGIIANQPLGLERRLKDTGLSDYIDLVVSSAEEEVSKPDPRIFMIALERCGCSAVNAVMIGDRLDNDIAPAKSLGMATIWLRQGFGGLSTPMAESEVPDYIADSLDEICGLFAL